MLVPWEDIAIEESELGALIGDIATNQKAIVFNPAYTLMFQSKGMMKILWDLYPKHPLLLETSFEPLEGKKQVKKPIYQEYVELLADDAGARYQAGLFYAYESCGLGFRKGGDILNNMSKFVGHTVEE